MKLSPPGLLLAALACTAACGSRSDPDAAPPRPFVGTSLDQLPDAFRDSCQRYCGAMELISVPCVPGAAMRHGVRLGSGEIPEDAPLSDDPECMATCTHVQDSAACWRQLAEYFDCTADALWLCGPDGYWGTAQCGSDGDPALCWED
jgi:hypothetical protein